MTGLAFEMWLVVLALYKAWERSRAGAVVEGLKLDLLSLLIRDKYVLKFSSLLIITQWLLLV